MVMANPNDLLTDKSNRKLIYLHEVKTALPKRLLKLKVRLPAYRSPRNAWRKDIHENVTKKLQKRNIHYYTNTPLELHVRLYLKDNKLRFIDVDNRLKDIMDALQGRVGGKGKKHKLSPIIQNDSQVYKVVVQKGPPFKQSGELGHLVMVPYRGPTYTRPCAD